MTEANPTDATSAPTSEDELLIRIADVSDCLACGTPGLLLVRYKHSWKNQSGDDVPGIRETLLCPQCSRRNTAAAELIALFAVDEQMNLENIDFFGGIVAAWVESLRQEHVDEELLVAEHDQWLRGAL
ncbi:MULTISPECIES: DUF6300 family protein [Streptomyces]|uniref:DUF6300 family protein n=1 Tax=Streptomyces TaxID=1883 RepID=UPI00158569E3|nr:DUF6300 family protein [Streptomyces lunaelactis]NUK16250.1 hypothetical protein [Streptomyces lunaelactis]